jgi:predicted phosphodiesterase
MIKKDLTTFLQEKQNKGSWTQIGQQFNVPGNPKQQSDFVRKLWKRLHKQDLMKVRANDLLEDWDEFVEFKKQKLGKILPKPYLKGDPNNVLIISDLHLPFAKEGYLKFCREQQERFNCGTVIQIGDVLDHHAQSFHDSNADGLSAKDELLLAVKQLEDWYSVFPKVTVTLGNHDRIVARKLFSVGLSQRWMRPLGEVLETPNWNYVEQIIHNGIMYIHGEGGSAIKKAQQEFISTVQGHLHSEGYIQLLDGGRKFAMQVGAGIDFNTYAFAYAQRSKKPIISCGVVLDQSPILIPFQ